MSKYRIPLKVYIYWSKCGLDVIRNYDPRRVNKKSLKIRNERIERFRKAMKGGILL